jgi:hypothetical protein
MLTDMLETIHYTINKSYQHAPYNKGFGIIFVERERERERIGSAIVYLYSKGDSKVKGAENQTKQKLKNAVAIIGSAWCYGKIRSHSEACSAPDGILLFYIY